MEDKLVEAIDEGRIVKVPEFYAKSEGLPIIRKPAIESLQKNVHDVTPGYQKPVERSRSYQDILEQKPPSTREKEVINDLVDNFHWQLRIERKNKGLSRKQLSKLVDISDNDLRMIETGRLPTPDFIIINKLQKALQINIRKDQKDYNPELNEMMSKTQFDKRRIEGGRIVTQSDEPKEQPKSSTTIYGDDIEILEDEI